MKTLSIIVLGVALGAMVTIGDARQSGEKRRMGGRGEGLREMLSLSDETAGKIEKLRVEHRKNQIALRAKLEAARVDFHSLMREDAPDEKLAMARQKEISSIREDLQAAALAHRFAVERLLTPEQRKLMKDHRGRGFWMGDREGPGFTAGDCDCGGCCGNDRPAKRGRVHRKYRMEERGRY